VAAERAAAAGLCLAGALALRLPGLGLPLDRDSAVYAVIGRGLRDGDLPYRDLIDHKQPLVYSVYALLDWLAPRSAWAIHFAAALLAGVAAWILYLVLREPYGRRRAGAAAALAVVLGASRYVEGFDFNTEHLMTLPATLAVAVALLAPGRHAFWIGALIGLAMLGKGVGILLAPAALTPLLLAAEDRRRALWRFAGGAVAPLALVAALYALAGGLGDLWTWNWTYNRQYTAALSLHDRLSALGGHYPLALVVAMAVVAAVARLAGERRRDPLTLTLALWLAGAILAGLAGGYGYAHYFFPVVLPAAALLAAPWPPGAPAVGAALAAVAVAPFALDLARNLADGTDALAGRAYGGNAPVWAAYQPVGAAIRARATPGDRLYVAENEAGFYWQAGLTPAARLLYESPLALRPELVPELQAAVCRRPPRFVVLPHGIVPEALRCLDGLGYRVALRHPPAVVVLERG
jgi:4-amino-4-deoxy-L-arabinose transferase-like glycosyltransferase